MGASGLKSINISMSLSSVAVPLTYEPNIAKAFISDLVRHGFNSLAQTIFYFLLVHIR